MTPAPRQDQVVVARINVQRVAAQPLGPRGLHDRAGGFLDGADVGYFGQLAIGARLYVHAGARGHVVDDDRLIGAAGDGFVMPEQPVLRTFVVVGRHDQQRVGARVGRVARERDAAVGRVAACARDDRHASAHLPHGEGDRLPPLVFGEGGGFARRAADDDGVGAAVDEKIQQPCKRNVVYPFFVGRRHDGGGYAPENRCVHSFIPNLSGKNS